MYAIIDYQENNWFFPHPTDNYRLRKETYVEPIISQKKITSNEINIQQFQELPSYRFDIPQNHSIFPFTFERKKHYYLYESLFADNGNVAVFPMITSPQRFYAPHFYSSYDVSKLELKIKFHIDSLSKFSIHFLNLVDISEIHPSPDAKNSNSLSFTDPNKIEYILNNGLSLYIHFPKSESLQESRNYVLSAIITLFLTVISTLLFNHLKKAYLRRKKYVLAIKHTQTSHPRFALLTLRHLVLYDISLCGLISLIIMLCNPYDYKLWEIVILLLGFTFIFPGLLYVSRLNEYTSNNFFKQEYKKWLKIILITIATFSMLLLSVSAFYRTIPFNDAFATMIGGIIGIVIVWGIIYIVNKFKK